MGVRIVPVGLIYEDKQRARSRAYIRVGEPIELDADLATNPGVPPDETDHEAVAALTSTIASRLADAAIDFRSAEQRSALRLAANVALRRERGDPRGRPPLGDVERLADLLSEAEPPLEAAVVAAATDYREALSAAQIPDAVVTPGAEEAFARRSRIGWVLTLALSPLAAIGLVTNAVPVIAVYAVGRRSMPPVTHATAKFLTAITLFPANWAVLRWVVLDDAPRPWLLTLALGPVCGLAALWCVGRAIRARRARLGLGRLAAASGLVDDLRTRRAGLVHAVRAATSRHQETRREGLDPDSAGSLDLQP